MRLRKASNSGGSQDQPRLPSSASTASPWGWLWAPPSLASRATSLPFNSSHGLAGFGRLGGSRRAFSSLTGGSPCSWQREPLASGFPSRPVHTRFLSPHLPPCTSGWCPEWIWHLFYSSLCSVNTIFCHFSSVHLWRAGRELELMSFFADEGMRGPED